MLTKSQKKLISEIDELVDQLSLDYKNVQQLEEAARLPTLKVMKDQYIRSGIISDYVFIDEILGSIICRYFFDNKKLLNKLWRTKKFRTFNHFILEKLYLGQKLDIVKNILKIDKKIESKIRRLNDLRNAIAHSFFVENLRGKRHFYNGKNIFTKEGFQEYLNESREIIQFFIKKAYGLSASDYDFNS